MFVKYIHKLKLQNFIKNNTITLLVLALVSSFFTYNELTKSQLSEANNPAVIIILIVIDLILVLVLSTLVARKLFRLWHNSNYKSGKLQNKIIFTFSVIAAVPTIIVTVFSTIFFNFGIQSWFDERVSTAINESVVVSESYFRVQLKLIESDVRIMAQDINYLEENILYGSNLLKDYLDKQAEDKHLIEAVVFQTNPNSIIAQGRYNFTIPFDSLPENAIKEAIENKIVVMKEDNDNKIRSLIKLDYAPNTYLLVGRFVDNQVLEHMINTKGAASEYEHLKSKISNLQIQFLIIFIVVSLLLIFTAIWIGIVLSSAIVKPLNVLISATEQISEGNFNIKLEDKDKNDEISVLSRAFNSMALELGNQRSKLIEANNEVDSKRQFSETVLSGVSAGVVALDLTKNISVINPAAINILSLGRDINPKNKNFDDVCPEISALLNHTKDFIEYGVKKEITINRDNRNLILVVKILTQELMGKIVGYIITFDDVTNLVLAQRTAAWADVARKIAHEIKNPLTPIHLASERLRKKYSSEVSDVKNFEKYIEIIVKHVKDIGAIVEEFVRFARMPSPNFEPVDLVQLLREAVFSRKCIDKNIDYVLDLNLGSIIINCDARQISQVLLNLLKNAEEAIESNSDSYKGCIKVQLFKIDNLIEVVISDNGGGFSDNLFDRITEPYVTTKSTGTGLGLAIVKKILDDHKIEISFENNDSGATVKLIINETLIEGKL